LTRVGIKQRLHVAGVRCLARREAVFLSEGLHESLGAFVLERPVPVCRAEDARDRLTGALGHQAAVERHNDLELLAVGCPVEQTELNRLRQRVHHVLAVVVQDQHVGVRVEHRGDILREVAGAQRRAHGRSGGPTLLFGELLHRLFGGVAPVVVRRQMVSDAILAIGVRQHRAERGARHVGVEEVAEAVAALVLAGGVVGVGQAGHEDDAHLLAQGLNGHGHARGRSTCHRHDAVGLDHTLGTGAGGVGLGLRVTGDVLDLLAVDAVAIQYGLFAILVNERVEHATVALTVQVLDGQLISAQFVRTLVGIRAGLRDVEAQRDGRAGRRVTIVLRPGIADKVKWPGTSQGKCCCARTSLEDGTTRNRRLGHG